MAKRSRKRDIITGMYISAAVVMILTRPVTVVATMTDGIITGRFYGEEAFRHIARHSLHQDTGDLRRHDLHRLPAAVHG